MIEQAILEAVMGPVSMGLLILMAGNLILSIVAALKNGIFEIGHLGDFINTKFWPWVGYVLAAMLAVFDERLLAVAVATATGLTAIYLRGILAAFRSLTGIKIPDILTEKKRG